MSGILYGVGVGPGDPELLTLKAVRILRESDVIGIPAADAKSCTAFSIAAAAVPELREKELLSVSVPMTKDLEKLAKAYALGCEKLAELLRQGKQIAFLNLGDPTIYGTYMELHSRIRNMGFAAEVVSGVPSFCAVAAALGEPLGARQEAIHILPGSYQQELNLPGTKILMKSGGTIAKVRQELIALQERENCQVLAVTNCTMEHQTISRTAESISETAGYFTTILIKDAEEK